MDLLRPVYRWLLAGCLLIAVMVIIGGITRLTESGLSITEWKPVKGAIPPLSQQDWVEEFDKYKATTEYQMVNQGMALSEFKQIFFWEYLHRLWGRLMGFAFIIPFLIFWRKGLLKGWLMRRCLIIMLGGSIVASLGWFMVMSGLKNTNSAFDLIKKLGLGLFVVVFIQIMYGAFTAGLNAGTIYNTWPLMNGEFMPENVTAMDGFFENFTNHKDGVQFVHRWFAFVVVGFVGYIWWELKGMKVSLTQSKSINFLIIAVCVQFLFGIATILFSQGGVPVWLGVLHQIGALGLLTAVTYFNHRVRKAFVA